MEIHSGRGGQCLWLTVIIVWWSPQLEIERCRAHHWSSRQPRRTIKSVGSSKKKIEEDKALDVNFTGEDLPNAVTIWRRKKAVCSLTAMLQDNCTSAVPTNETLAF